MSWRFPIAFQGLFALVVVSCILFLPESPRWLARSGQMEEAASVLARMEDVDVQSEHVAQELEIMQHSLHMDTDESISTSPFALTKNRHLHRTIIAVGVNILAQMTGVNIITF